MEPELEMLSPGIAVVKNNGYRLDELGSSVNFLMNCAYNGTDRIILYEDQLHQDFFKLSTGWAGEILQKVSTYNLYLAVIGNWDKHYSKKLQAFIIESNRAGRILFAENIDQVLKKWKNT